jgi:pyridoxal phosphate enzyme (YggS family)
LEDRIVAVRARIERGCAAAGRDPAEVGLVAVTKGIPGRLVGWAAERGIEDFGENYVNELQDKRAEAPDARWHFLGRVQSNKAPAIAEADLVQGLEPGRGADRLARLGRERGRPVACLVEVDFTGRRQGVGPDDLRPFLERVAGEPGLDVRGLMTVAPPSPDPEEARPFFARLRELRDGSAPGLRELSMGMSADFPVAVEEGATMVRIGTALFGERPAM